MKGDEEDRTRGGEERGEGENKRERGGKKGDVAGGRKGRKIRSETQKPIYSRKKMYKQKKGKERKRRCRETKKIEKKKSTPNRAESKNKKYQYRHTRKRERRNDGEEGAIGRQREKSQTKREVFSQLGFLPP